MTPHTQVVPIIGAQLTSLWGISWSSHLKLCFPQYYQVNTLLVVLIVVFFSYEDFIYYLSLH